MSKTKVVFEDAGRNKVIFGTTKDLGDFLEVVTDYGDILTINKKFIVFMREVG